MDSVRAMEATPRDPGKNATIQIYPGADHGFANPSGQAYNAAWVAPRPSSRGT